jgi:DNA end-binding protein Ku
MARRKASKKKALPARPLWRGHLKLSLVSCPVALFNAISESEDIHLHFLNPDTGNRIRYQSVDAETEEVVERADLVKGYEFQKDRYVTLTNEELDDLKIESSSVMTIEQCVEDGDIDPRYFERAYYLIPDGDAGEEAFAVIRDALQKSGLYAITRAVIARKERVIALKPCQKGLMGWALREAEDIRDTDTFFDDIEAGQAGRDEVSIALKLVNQKKGKFDPDKFDDRYEKRLRQLIDAKLEGVELEPEEIEEEPKVINLMDALKKSLGQGSKNGRRGSSNDNESERKSASVHKLTLKKKTAKKKTAGKKKAAKARKRA